MNVGRALLLVIPISLVSSSALAEEAPPAEGKAVAPREAPAAPAPAPGLVVFVDPVTGKIRQPDPAEIGALTAPKPGTEAAAPAPEAPLVMRSGPGGAVGIVLDSRFESFMVVRKTPDGKLAMDCVAGDRSADAAVAAGAKAAGKTENTAKTAEKRKKEKEEAVRVP